MILNVAVKTKVSHTSGINRLPALIFLILLNVSGTALSQSEKSTIEHADYLKKGANIYLSGRTIENVAYIGDNTSKAPSSLFPCKNCHGIQGQGLTEGGVEAPDIRWAQLAIQYRSNKITYGRALLKRALLKGIDAKGNKMSKVMPRYLLKDEEIDHLKMYLRFLENPQVKGADETKINIAVVLPKDTLQAEVIRQVLNAYFNSLNKKGGVFNRQINLNFDSSKDAFFVLNINTDEFSHAEPVALTVNNTPEDISINTLSIFKRSNNAGRFNLYTREHTVSVLKQYARQKDSNVIEINNFNKDELKKLFDEMVNPAKTSIIYTGELDTEKLQKLVALLGELDVFPLLMLSNDFYGAGELYPGNVVTVKPPITHHVTKEGQIAYIKLAKIYDLPKPYLTQQLWVLGAAQVLTEGLLRTGHNLHVDKLVNVLEKFYRYETYYGPDITFVANQQSGAMGGTVVSVSKLASQVRFTPQWIEL